MQASRRRVVPILITTIGSLFSLAFMRQRVKPRPWWRWRSAAPA